MVYATEKQCKFCYRMSDYDKYPNYDQNRETTSFIDMPHAIIFCLL